MTRRPGRRWCRGWSATLVVLAAVGDEELGDEPAEAVALLALVVGQDVEPGERPGTWRIARRVARDRVIFTVDPQARHTRKTSAAKRDDYKGHIAAEPRDRAGDRVRADRRQRRGRPDRGRVAHQGAAGA
jgi:hypothetical protein